MTSPTVRLADELAKAVACSSPAAQHGPSCYGGTDDRSDCWCGTREVQRALDAYVQHRAERPHGWRGYFSRRLAEALAAVSKLVGQ